MLAVKVPLKKAEAAKNSLIKKGIIERGYLIFKEKEFIYLPVKERFKTGFSFADKKFEKIEKPKTLREALEGKLTEKELFELKTAFDVVGEIAILEIDDELRKKEKIIGKALLATTPNIKTVLRKEGSHTGEFRAQKMKFLAGRNTKETVHKELGVKLKLNVEKVYFSPRITTERKRIMELVKPGEDVLVMFSGAGPYVCVIAKNTKAKSVYGVEINPDAHKYALENAKENWLYNVRLFLGDVRKVVPKLNKKFDRILMPLPKSGENFLDTALGAAKEKAVIHFYDFLDDRDIPKKAYEKVKKACERNKRKCRILGFVRCGQLAPRAFRVCVDFECRA